MLADPQVLVACGLCFLVFVAGISVFLRMVFSGGVGGSGLGFIFWPFPSLLFGSFGMAAVVLGVGAVWRASGFLE